MKVLNAMDLTKEIKIGHVVLADKHYHDIMLSLSCACLPSLLVKEVYTRKGLWPALIWRQDANSIFEHEALADLGQSRM